MKRGRYDVRIRAVGEWLDSYDTIDECRLQIEIYEAEDIANNEYEENYYEIYDKEKDEVIE